MRLCECFQWAVDRPRTLDVGSGGGEVIERLVPVLVATVLVDHQQRKWRLRPVGGHKEPGGVDVLFDAAGGQTRDQAVGVVRGGPGDIPGRCSRPVGTGRRG